MSQSPGQPGCAEHPLQIGNLKVMRDAVVSCPFIPPSTSAPGKPQSAINWTAPRLQQWASQGTGRGASNASGPAPPPAASSPAGAAGHLAHKDNEQRAVGRTLPRSGDAASHFSSLANWPYELGKVRPFTSVDVSLIIYKVRWLN